MSKKGGKKVLVVGSGAREDALAWALGRSTDVEKVYIAPGNAGTGRRINAKNVGIDASDVKHLVNLVQEKDVSLTVVGPEGPLYGRIADVFREHGLPIIGPTYAASEIERSKKFMHTVAEEAGVAAARYVTLSKYSEAREYVKKHGPLLVIKKVGPASGKGVVVTHTHSDAKETLRRFMEKKAATKHKPHPIIVEERLFGTELSGCAVCDGSNHVSWPFAQDHKQIAEDGKDGNNESAMTGGMGAIAPVPGISAMAAREADEIIGKFLRTLDTWGRNFTGWLYPGFMLGADRLKVLEVNARLGDPEAQVYMRLLKTPLLDILEACVNQTLGNLAIEWLPGFAVNIVLVSGGYPGKYQTGYPISGIEEAEKVPGVIVFHGGTKVAGERLVTAGGRVLGVSAVGSTLKEALDCAYQAVGLIRFKDMYYRRDIGAKALALV